MSKLIKFTFFHLVYYRPNFYFYWPTHPSELTQMNCISSAIMIKSLEISVFTWNNLVLSVKSSKECTPNYFRQIFSFFEQFYYRPNFHFYWPTLRSESTHMNYASSASLAESLEISVFIWNDLVLAVKSSR